MNRILRYILGLLIAGVLLPSQTVCAQAASADSIKGPDFLVMYYPFVHRAMEASLFGDFKEAVDNYAEAFEDCQGFAMDYLAAAESAARLGAPDTAFKWLRLAVRRGVPLKMIRKKSAFRAYKKSDDWSRFLRDYPGLYRTYLNGVDYGLRKEIVEMVQEDRSVRKPKNAEKAFEQIQITDSLHKKRLWRIVKTKGFPGERLIGNYWVDKNEDANADILFQHIAFTDSIGTISLLKKAIREGEAPPVLLAFTTDLMRAMQGEPQIYGTFVSKGKRIYPIEDEENIDKIRESVGLEPFELFLLRSGLKYPGATASNTGSGEK